ncbi:hypothetical protein ATCC90586_001594 [Pythium insidiosum]|nr:hypothetical protein ATCC90586_001594 [Pythium insidiosum]
MRPDDERAKQRMLRLWAALGERRDDASSITIVMSNSTVVHADELLANGTQTLLGASNLVTPLGRYPSAVLRAADIAQIDARLSPPQLRRLLQELP